MKLQRDKSGQALLEFAFVLPMLCVFLLGVVDYGRAIYDSEVMMNLAGEGSSLASRSSSGSVATNLTLAANTVMADAGPMSGNGCAILTAVQATNNSGTWTYTIAAQQQPNMPSCTISVTSRIGCYSTTGGCNANKATVPPGVQNALMNSPAGVYVYVTEVFYKFTYATPVGGFLGGTGALPTDLYTVAYF